MFACSRETTAIRFEGVRATKDDMDLALDIFLAQRTRLFRTAYRILDDASRAEDVVQDVWVRWQRTDRARVENPAAFLTTVTSRLAINVIQSARHRHEVASESHLRNVTDPTIQDPVLRAEQTVAIEEALARLMARLTPDGLAAYVLRKGFDYAYTDLARLLDTSVVNARQLVRRAQARLDTDGGKPVPTESHRHLVAAFRTAASTGDLTGLTQILAPEDQGSRMRSSTDGSRHQVHDSIPQAVGRTPRIAESLRRVVVPSV
ncbi:sigma factor [Streptomyces antibioticus]|uniref:sigma factor n=1 Tax=Streptomyces antibioticus TaxID=1890 RepID=UPI0036B7E42F